MNKRPIVIVASARSGSSAFAWHIGNLHNIEVWTEPTRNLEEFENFKKFVTTDNDYVLKIITYQIKDTEIYQSILKNNCYKIKLTRENKIDQIASHYIGNITNIWNSNNKYARGKEYTVKIDQHHINSVIQTVINNDQMFDDLKIEFDEEHTYEELIKTISLDSTGQAKMAPPTNFDLLKKAIEIEYAKYR